MKSPLSLETGGHLANHGHVAKRGGQTIASKQLSVSATGGM